MVPLDEEKKYIKVASEVIDLEIKALIKLKKSINESFNLASTHTKMSIKSYIMWCWKK